MSTHAENAAEYARRRREGAREVKQRATAITVARKAEHAREVHEAEETQRRLKRDFLSRNAGR